jgi:DNA invertase Pin-like site-specific DNA recombinase
MPLQSPHPQHVAWIYIRESDEDQLAGHSPEYQAKVTRERAAELGYTVARLEWESGTARTMRQRKVWQRYHRAIKRHEMDAVIVWKYARLARNFFDQVKIIADARDFGVELISYLEPLDKESKWGKVLLLFQGVFNEQVSDEIREQSMAGTRMRIEEKGMPPVAARPLYGYRWVEREDTSALTGRGKVRKVALEHNPETAPRAYAMWHYLDAPDKTHTACAHWMNAQGWPSPTSKEWQATTIRWLIDQGYYWGEPYAYKTERREVQVRDKETGEVYLDVRPRARSREQWVKLPIESVPPIVERDVAMRVRQYAAERGAHHRPPTAESLERSFLIGGLVRCGICGHAMSYRASRATRAPSFYCSQGTKAGANHTRHGMTVTVHDAEAFAVHHLLKLLSDSTEAEAALSRLAEQRDETDSDMEHAIERLAEVGAKIARRKALLDTITNLDEIAAYGAELDMLHVEEAGWKAEIEALSRKDEHVRSMEATLHTAVHAARARADALRARVEELPGVERWLRVPDPEHPEQASYYFPMTDPERPGHVRVPQGPVFSAEEAETLLAFEHASNPDKRRVMRALGVHVAVHRGKQRHPETRLEFMLPLGLRSPDGPDSPDGHNGHHAPDRAERAADGTHSQQNAVAFSTKAISSGAQPTRAAAAL